MELIKRPRRLRCSEGIRRLVGEVSLSLEDLIYPLFVVPGNKIKKEIPSMLGIFHFSVDLLLEELSAIQKLGIQGVILFGVPDEHDKKSGQALNTCICDGVVQNALRMAKSKFPEMIFIADICLCGYTDHGHCGIVSEGRILNDASLDFLCKFAVSCAEAGADIIAPSDMMDGRVLAIRRALDYNNFTDKAILSYSIKYASSFYGPFRDAAKSKPLFGDRRTYQMNYANTKEALREAELDIEEGADIIMIKPALAYLDVIGAVSREFNVPVAAYNVSGEYSMIKAAAEKGWINEKEVVLESVTAMKRAGAKIIITYFAKQIAGWLKEG